MPCMGWRICQGRRKGALGTRTWPRARLRFAGSPSASRGSACAIALYTWASRGETLASTLAAQTVLRVRKGRPLTRPVYLFGLRPLHLCGTRLEGGHQGLSRRYGSVEGEPVAWCRRRPRPLPNTRAMRKRRLVRCGGYPVAEDLPRVCAGAGVPADDVAARFGSTHTNLNVRESLRCP